jgi:hypothetical protein
MRRWFAHLNIYWVEFALAVAAVIGIGALIAVADVQRPVVKATILSFSTIACLLCLSYLQMATGPAYLRPPVLPPLGITVPIVFAASAMLGGMAGAVTIALRSIRVRRGRPSEPSRDNFQVSDDGH